MYLTELNKLLGTNLRVPTIKEWNFAAKGGNYSQGYTYSGSNDLAEVGWYSSNSNSKLHEVAQLLPNELGFYDMSGNLREWTSTKSGSYSSYYYYCGGSYSDGESYCKPTSYDYSSSTRYTGLRLALSFN